MSKFKVSNPSNFLLVGATRTGKTSLMLDIIRDREEIFAREIESIYYCFEVWQNVFDNFPFVNFHQGLIKNVQEVFPVSTNPNKQHILVIDDMVTDIEESGVLMSKIFSVYGHHLNINVFLLTQNLFYQNKFFRNITLNTHYIILLQMRRDKSQLKRFFSQIYPSKSALLMEVYNQSTRGKFKYLMVDLSPDKDVSFLLRTNILPREIETVYIPKDC